MIEISRAIQQPPNIFSSKNYFKKSVLYLTFKLFLGLWPY